MIGEFSVIWRLVRNRKKFLTTYLLCKYIKFDASCNNPIFRARSVFTWKFREKT